MHELREDTWLQDRHNDDTGQRRTIAGEWAVPPGGASPRIAGTAAEPLSIEQRLARIIGQASFERYFGRVRITTEGGRVEVHAPSRAAADVLRRRFGVALRQAAADGGAAGAVAEIVFLGDDDAPVKVAALVAPVVASVATPAVCVTVREPQRSPAAQRAAVAATRYRLEDFVVGESNGVAFNAAAQMAEGEGPAGTLFIHGPCGLGKTHLLQGVAQRFRERMPGAVVRVTSGEAFMNDFVASIRAAGAARNGAAGGGAASGGASKFRRAYRQADLLCIDDVHFLAAKQATQDELLHTFDEIERGGARVLLVSDQHPRALRKFSPALVSRFMSGMVASISPPEAALRERIVRTFAARRGILLDDAGVRAIAARAAWLPNATTGPSIRDIEGMLTKIDALRRVAPEYAAADGRIGAVAVERALGGAAVQPVSGDAATVHVAVAAPRPAKPVRMHTIIASTCAALAIDPGELAGKTRHKRVVLARALITYIARALTTQSFPDIARAIGRPSHSTVITAYQRFCTQLQADEPVALDPATEPTSLGVLTRQLLEAVVHASARA